MRLSSCVPRRVPPARASVQSALFGSSVAALASRSPRFFARSRQSLRARARGSGPGCPAKEPALHPRSPAGHTQCLGGPLTGQSRAAQPALVTLDSLFAFARPAPLRVACLSFIRFC